MSEEAEHIKCPSCAETIKKEAAFCRFCGYNLKTGERPLPEPTHQPQPHPAHHYAQPAHQSVGEVKARSGVMDGVKLGCGMFIVLPILITLGALFLLYIIGASLS